MRRTALVLVGASLFAALLHGCGHEAPVAPQSAVTDLDRAATPLAATDPDLDSRPRLFYPLAPGNRWSYAGRSRFLLKNPGEADEVVFDAAQSLVSEQVCEVDPGTGPYVVEGGTLAQGANTYQSWLYLRQDRGGLYELDGPIGAPECADPAALRAPVRGRADALAATRFDRIADPARRAAFERALATLRARVALIEGVRPTPIGRAPNPGPREGELLRLKYPLLPGQHWNVRPDESFGSVVEGISPMLTPAGPFLVHRVRMLSDLFGPNDRVLTFYSRRGIVGHRYHMESEAVDESGNPIGRLIWDDTLLLQTLHLERAPAL